MMHYDSDKTYTRARQAYENDNDLVLARQLFQDCIERFPDTIEAEYAKGFIDRIDKGLAHGEVDYKSSNQFSFEPGETHQLSSSFTWLYKFMVPSLSVIGLVLMNIDIFLSE